MVHVVVRAMQKANNIAEIMNFWPRLMLTWKMVRCAAAPTRKRAKNVEVIGPSKVFVGVPPRRAVVGG